jgi:hypothetical protein
VIPGRRLLPVPEEEEEEEEEALDPRLQIVSASGTTYTSSSGPASTMKCTLSPKTPRDDHDS